MLSRKITFVLGAGASAELGFPLGSALQIAIQRQARSESALLSANPTADWNKDVQPISVAMSKSSYNRDDILVALNRLREGILEAPSIDTFLHNNNHNRAVVDCGKIAIALSIILAEQMSPVFGEDAARAYCSSRDLLNERGIPYLPYALGQSFVSQIWNEICQPHTREDVEKIFQNLSFVNFNYDRSLEETFVYKLRTNFGLSDSDSRELVDKLEVIRPYGSPHGDSPFSNCVPRYGRPDTAELLDCAKQIRTFTEAVSDDIPNRIESLMTSAVVVFLGFGFHRQNVELFRKGHGQPPMVYFSLFEGSEENAKHIERLVKSRIGLIGSSAVPTSAAYRYHFGSSLDTLRYFQFPIFRSA
jgi:hypothetical protein